MYKIYATRNDQTICIHNDEFMTEETKTISPSLTLAESNAGELSLKIPPTNAGYDFIERLNTEIYVTKADDEIWRGRVLTIKEDFQKNKTLKCEGELAYLNDTTQPQEEMVNLQPISKLSKILTTHNSKSSKKFYTGIVTVTDPNGSSSDYTNYESSMAAISNKLVAKFGGYINLRKGGYDNYIDYLREEDRPTSIQEVRFGDNLLDFTKSFDSTDFCTVVLPLGKQIGTEYADDGTSIGAYVTIESVNSGSPYLVNQEAVDRFGWIEKVVNYSNIEDPEELMMYGQLYLASSQFDNMVLECSAVDLSYLGTSSDYIRLSYNIHVISTPHGLDRYFPVTKITIPIDHPENTTFTMGTEVKVSMSAKSVSGTNSIYDKLNTYSQYVGTALDEAKQQASAIMNQATTGYVTTIKNNNGSEELLITNQPLANGYDTRFPREITYTSGITKYWRWNSNGLAYYNQDLVSQSNPTGMVTAWTMDGKFNADVITTGTLNAERVKAGVLSDKQGKFYLNMENGTIQMSNATLTGGSLTVGRFSLTNSGGLTSSYDGITSNYSYSGTVNIRTSVDESYTINLNSALAYFENNTLLSYIGYNKNFRYFNLYNYSGPINISSYKLDSYPALSESETTLRYIDLFSSKFLLLQIF